MSLHARLDRLTAWHRAEAERFAETIEERLAARVRLQPSPDYAAALDLMVQWCAVDPTLEPRLTAAYQVLGLLDAAGQLVPGSPAADALAAWDRASSVP